MKVGLGYRGRMRGDLGPAGQEIDLTHQALTAWREGEHNIDGGHTNVTAETLAVDGATEFGGPWTKPQAAVITPPQITADQNDYRPRFLETAIWLRLSTDASRTITGIHRSLESGLDAFRWLCIANIGNFDIVLSHNDVLSQSRNRFGCPGGVDLTIQTSECVWLWYDNNSANWRVVAGSGAASGGSSAPPGPHAADHENGGSDEISVAGLSGLLADDQNPTAHASDHQNGGGDEISVAGLSGLLADAQLTAVRKNSTGSVFTRTQLNFIEGTNVTLTVADDGTEVDVTIASAGGGGLSDADYGDITVSGGGTVLTIDSGVVTPAKSSTALKTRQVTFALDGAGSDITTGQKYAYITVPYSGTITAWRIVSPDTDDIVIDVLKGTYAGFPTVATITGGAEPELSGVDKDEDTVSWAVTAGDILDVEVISCSGITRCTLTLTVVLS